MFIYNESCFLCIYSKPQFDLHIVYIWFIVKSGFMPFAFSQLPLYFDKKKEHEKSSASEAYDSIEAAPLVGYSWTFAAHSNRYWLENVWKKDVILYVRVQKSARKKQGSKLF